MLELPQAAPHQDAILLHQRHDVGHRADGDEIEIFAQVDLAVPLAREFEQAVADLEDQTHAGEIIERAIFRSRCGLTSACAAGSSGGRAW